MRYPGGKNGAGVHQAIINNIPPHDVYVEAFAGSAAVFRHKLPARRSFLIDKDPEWDPRGILADAADRDVPGYIGEPAERRRRGSALRPRDPEQAKAPILASRVRNAEAAGVICMHADAREWLAAYQWSGREFVYLDPPYLAATRRRGARRIYRCELREEKEHLELLSVIQAIPAAVMISGYWSALYAKSLQGWRSVRFTTSTRGGPAEEILWMNYPEPEALHDYRYLGGNFRERQDFKRMRERWARRLAIMPRLKRQALLAAITPLFDRLSAEAPRKFEPHGSEGVASAASSSMASSP